LEYPFAKQVYKKLPKPKQGDGNHPFPHDGDAFVLPAVVDPEETAKRARENEQHEFQRSQVKTNKKIAHFTGWLVIATICTIGVGIWQATITRSLFTKDQRPYIVIQDLAFADKPPSAGYPIYANISLRNIGKTPALMIVNNVKLLRYDGSGGDNGRKQWADFLNASFEALESKSKAGTEERRRLGSDQDLAPNEISFTTSNPVIIPKEDFSQLATNQATLVFIGVITYTDEYEATHVTEFCNYYFGADPRIWHSCDSRNTIR
jgi:hypothetical protein